VLLHGDQAAIHGANAPRHVAFVPKSLHNLLLVLCFLRPLDCFRGWIQNTQPAQQRSTDTVGLRTTTEMLSCGIPIWIPAAAKSSCATRSSRSPTAFSFYYKSALWNWQGCWVAYVVLPSIGSKNAHAGIRNSYTQRHSNSCAGKDAQFL
jgi:hypothetical protein